jgi:hypothetical protein
MSKARLTAEKAWEYRNDVVDQQRRELERRGETSWPQEMLDELAELAKMCVMLDQRAQRMYKKERKNVCPICGDVFTTITNAPLCRTCEVVEGIEDMLAKEDELYFEELRHG